MSTDAPGGENEADLSAPEILLEAVAEPSEAAHTAGDWLCAWCLNRVANERDRFRYQGKDEFAFHNPEGLRFEILTFSRTLACDKTGVPTPEHTWFEGHVWSYCVCSRCHQHLGWYYSGEHNFAGLIKTRLVRALHVRN